MYSVAQARNDARCRRRRALSGPPTLGEREDAAECGVASGSTGGKPHMSAMHHARRGAAAVAAAAFIASALVVVPSPPPGSAAVGDVLGADSYLVSRANAGTSDQSELSDDGQHVVFR